MEKLLTIGITTHNNVPFIDQLIYNIKNQITKNREILDYLDFFLYDDNSNNNDFLNDIPEYFQTYSNKKTNGTPSIGRNYIIKNSNSKYILFIDGDDDIICPLEELVSELKEKEGDILVSEVSKIDADGNLWKSPFIYTNFLFSKNLSSELKEEFIVHQTGLWSVYKVEFLKKHNIYYDKFIRYEDNYFLFNILLNNPKIDVLKTKYYGWRNNYQSFSYTDESLENRVKLYEKSMKLLKVNLDNKYAPKILFSIWNQTYSNIIRNYPNLDNKKRRNYFEKLNKISKKYQKEIKILKNKTSNKYTDKYFKWTKLSIFRTYLFINTLRKIKYILNNKKNIKKKILTIFTKFPLNKNKIFLTSQYGEYTSNPKYLYLEMKNDLKYKNKKIVFAVKDTELAKEKDFINYNNRILYYFHYYTAKTVYFDTWMDPRLSKRKKQIWVQMWHGYPYKKMYKDITIYNKVNTAEQISLKEKNIEKWDEIYSLDYKNTKIFQNLFPAVKIVEKNYPRIEWLINNKNNKKLKDMLIKKYQLNNLQKYTLYAPTYRPYKLYISIEEILKNCKRGNVLLIHEHPMLKYKISDEEKLNNKNIIFLKKIVDMQEILLLIDELITDYSSIAYDFKQISDQIKYYQPDIRLYEKFNGITY